MMMMTIITKIIVTTLPVIENLLQTKQPTVTTHSKSFIFLNKFESSYLSEASRKGMKDLCQILWWEKLL